jgi:hypothetical protein
MSITGNDIKKLKRSYKTSPAIRISTIYIIISCVYMCYPIYLVSVLLVDIKTYQNNKHLQGLGFCSTFGVIYILDFQKKEKRAEYQ